ncbi:MAG: TonB-dependent receptor [Pseudomonadota bacterium]
MRLIHRSFALMLPTCVGLTALMSPTPVLAQGQDAVALEEIVVTARRREESLQQVPVAVSAFSGAQLEELGVQDIVALAQSTPNLTLEVSRATSTTLTAFIRGVGQQDPVAGFEGGVGLYLDDVYLARPQGTVFDVYDVERIEVLRGPQGTLYGRNTIGGAVKYVTKRLSDQPEGNIRVNVGSYNQLDGVLTGSMPLSDTFRIGGTIASFNRDGFGTNLTTNDEHYDKAIVAARFSAEWEPSDSVFVRFAADYSDDDSNPKSGHRLVDASISDAPVLDDVFDTRAGVELIASSNAGLRNEVTQGGFGLTIDWDINDQFAFKSVTAYREDDTETLIDFDSLASNDFDAPVIYENDQFSQEFQLNYTNDRWSGVFGVYYLQATAFNAFDVVLGNLGVTSFTLGDVDTDTWAAFADVSYAINDEWTLSVGGRFSSDERSVTITRELFLGLGSPYFGNDAAVSLTVPAPGLVPTFTGSRTDEDFNPRISLSYAPSDEHNLYASFSQGFKGGGFDPRGAYNVPGVDQGFEPETVDSIEFGAKSLWLDNRLSTNIAVFFSDYENVQVPGSIGIDTNNDGVDDSFAGTTTNAAKAEISGIEIEAAAQFTDSFSGNFSLGYIDPEFKEWIVDGVDVSSERVFQNTPDLMYSISLRQEWPLEIRGIGGGLALIGSASYRDDTSQFEIPVPLVDQESFTLVDVSLVWTSDDASIQAGIHGRNLTDEEYKVAAYNFPTLGLENNVSAFYGNPLTVTGTLSVRF